MLHFFEGLMHHGGQGTPNCGFFQQLSSRSDCVGVQQSSNEAYRSETNLQIDCITLILISGRVKTTLVIDSIVLQEEVHACQL